MSVNFSTIDKVKVISIGNTLVLSGKTDNVFPPLNGDLSTISEATTESLLTFTGQATTDWTQSGSSAILDIFKDSTVEFAQLVWYSTVANNRYGARSVIENQDDSITFVTPKESISLAPEYMSSLIIDDTDSNRLINHLRVTDVTAYVQNGLSGTYSVLGVPTSIPDSGLSSTRAGWALNIVIKNKQFKPQYVGLVSGISTATPEGNIQYFVSGFEIPELEVPSGYLTLIAANGEPYKYGERLQIGENFASSTIIGNKVGVGNENPQTAPNNPFDNPFTGQINVANPLNDRVGLLDTTGTKGSINNEAFTPLEVVGARNKWDILCIDLKDNLKPSQSTLSFQLSSRKSGAIYEILTGIVQLDALGGDFDTLFEVDKSFLEVDKKATYRLRIENVGLVDTTNIIIEDKLDPTIEFIKGSIRVNGQSFPEADITTGLRLQSIEKDKTVTITYDVKAVDANESASFENQATITYDFVSGNSEPYTNILKTNVTNVEVEQGHLMIEKSLNKETALVNEDVEYLLTLKNDGTVPIKSVKLVDKLDPSLAFIPNSIFLNGVMQPGIQIEEGLSIATIDIDEVVTVSFKAIVASVPPLGYIQTKTYAGYSYRLPNQSADILDSVMLPSEPLLVNYSEITQFISNNNDHPLVGDTVTYTITLTNTGNIEATDIPVKVVIPEGIRFVDESLSIDGQAHPELNPIEGFTIDSLEACTSSILVFDGTVEDIPDEEEIVNIAYIPYRYQIDPNGNVIQDELESNEVVTRTNHVDLSITKEVNKEHATVGDEVVYTFTIINNGNIKATNVNFLDVLDAHLTFVPGSIKVNCEAYPDYDPNQGFRIEEIGIGDTYTISFIAQISEFPPLTQIPNKAQMTYEYQPDPNRKPLKNSETSNEVITTVTTASISFDKVVDKAIAQVGDTLTYVFKARNTGVVDLKDIFFADPLPASVAFIPGSVSINTLSYPDLNPVTGFIIQDLSSSEEATISFSVTVTSLPVSYFVKNRGQLTYSSQLNEDEPVVRQTIDSNVAETNILSPIIEIEKFVDKAVTTIDDQLVYSFKIYNKGNVDVRNLVFEDILQQEAEFISNTVRINDVIQPGFNPNNTFSLGELEIGDVIHVEFMVRVSSLPVPNIIENDSHVTFDYDVERTYSGNAKSNSVETIINVGDLTITKAVDKEYATLDEIITYTATIQNVGNVTVSNVTFADMMPEGATFVPESLMIDFVSFPNATPSNLPLNDITAGSKTIVSFDAEVSSIPESERLDNIADVTYTYKIDPEGQPTVVTETSNEVTTFINVQTVAINKAVDLAYATVSDELIYTIMISNNGNVDLVQTEFTDLLPKYIPFIMGSVLIDGQSYPSYNPSNGFTLNTIVPNQSVKVEFKVSVFDVPPLGYVENDATLDYLYKLTPDGPFTPDSITSNKVRTDIREGSLTIEKQANRQFAAIDDIVTYTFLLKNTGNTDLINLVFSDIIQVDGSAFKSGTVLVDNSPYPAVNPNDGFKLPNLTLGHTMTISFDVDVTNVPSTVDEAIYNTAEVSYDFLIDPNDPLSTVTQTEPSNETIVYVRDTKLTLQKAVSDEIAKVNDILTYSFVVSNPGNVDTTNNVLYDTFDENVSFNEGSVVVNGVIDNNSSPITGIDLGTIEAGRSITVSFTAKINSIPDDRIIENIGHVDYNYLVGPEVVDESVTSNMVETKIVTAELKTEKEVNKAYAELDETLTYTVRITNIGTVIARSISVTDLLDENIEFIRGSVFVNGNNIPGADLVSGISVPNLEPEASAVVTFDVVINSLPENPYIIENTASVDFEFIDPVTGVSAPGPTSTTNTVETEVVDESLTIVKSVDKAYATLEDILTYTLLLRNEGNVLLSNVNISDTIQLDAEFITGSITINDGSYPELDVESFSLPFNLGVDEEAIVQFNVRVKTSPSSDYINNTAQATANYMVDPEGLPKQVQRISNRVQTKVNVSSIETKKSVNKQYATIGDTLLYSVDIINTGTVTLSDLNFLDLVPQGARFVSGSVYVNGVNRPTSNPNNSISLNNIPVGQSTTVKFNATVVSIPEVNPLPNTANLTYTYQIDPQGEEFTDEAVTNTVFTQINEGVLTLEKAVDKTFALIGDELQYTVIARNDGNVELTNVLFRDVLQSELQFIENSVEIDGVSVLNANPEDGFNLPNLAVDEFVTVTFNVLVTELPTNSFVENVATATFAYKIDPEGPTINETEESNVVRTDIRELDIDLSKVVDKAYATLNENLLYTNILRNLGTIPVTDVMFNDDIPQHTSFVPGSVIIGTERRPDLNIEDGILLGTLNPGESRAISFYVQVQTLPEAPEYLIPNTSTADYNYQIDPESGEVESATVNSNEVQTRINLQDLVITKAVNREYAELNDLITYTIMIENTGNIDLTNVLFTDELQEELSFISGTVSINGVQRGSLNPETGFSLETLAPADKVSITFDSRLSELPPTFKVDNDANVQYDYKIDPEGNVVTESKDSNLVTTKVINPVLASTKAVSKEYATLDDVLTYTITLNNSGNTDLDNVMFNDIPSTGVEFIKGSVSINDVIIEEADPTQGIDLSTLPKNSITTIRFDVLVTSVPASNEVTNKAFIDYEYTVDPTQAPIAETSQTNLVKTIINVVNTEVVKAVDKQFATIGDVLNYTVTVTNKGNVPNTNVRFVDPTPMNSTFVLGSVMVNGISEPTFNPEAGFNLGTLQPNQVVTVEYQVTVTQ